MTALSFRTQKWSVNDVLRRFPQLRLDPEYQREGNVWGLARRQLFVDSVLNGFDSPKIYLHELVPPEFEDETLQRFAVVDGRQRLEALRAFSAGDFALSADFRLLQEDVDGGGPKLFDDAEMGGQFAGMTMADLAEHAPTLARRFNAYPLTIVVVDTPDIGYIEELFQRLNEGSPLSSAEKRNRGALLREAIGQLREHAFFASRLKVKDRRGRHGDLALRMLFLEEMDATDGGVPDMRLAALNEFASQFRPAVGQAFDLAESGRRRDQLMDLSARVVVILNALTDAFGEADPLLGRVGDVLTYYVALRSHAELHRHPALREEIEDFFLRANALEGFDEEGLSPDELAVLDHFGAVQGTTTGSYLAARASLLWRFIDGHLDLRAAP